MSKEKLIDSFKSGLILFLVSLLLIAFAMSMEDEQNTKFVKIIIEILKQLSIAVAIASTVGFYISKRSENWFKNTVLDAIRLKSSISESGISEVSTNFQSVEWEPLIQGSSEITLYNIRHSYQWIKQNKEALLKCLQKKSGKLILAVPDHKDIELMNYLARKHDSNQEREINLIKDSIEQSLKALEELGVATKDKVEIVLTKYYPTYALYKFNKEMVITLYGHARAFKVPTFILIKDGLLYDSINEDFDRLMQITKSDKSPEHSSTNTGEKDGKQNKQQINQ